jgi:hypothetical protein
MAATPSVKVTKSYYYRGAPKTFSNRYHFVGGVPADDAHWHTLMDNIVVAEKAIYDSAVTITGCTGYLAGSEVPVSTKTYTTAGTYAGATNRAPGDAAALIRYATAARSSKNHPVFLFSYYHDVWQSSSSASSGGVDTILAAQATLYAAYAAAWVGAGFSDGTTSYNRAGPKGATATGYLVETYITHRDFRK